MSKYTIELGSLLQRGYELPLKNYPIFSEDYRETLNNKIIEHFYFREIGCETPDRFAFYLRRKLNEIMPYYNQLYTSELLQYNPLYTEFYESNEDFENQIKDMIKSLLDGGNLEKLKTSYSGNIDEIKTFGENESILNTNESNTIGNKTIDYTNDKEISTDKTAYTEREQNETNTTDTKGTSEKENIGEENEHTDKTENITTNNEITKRGSETTENTTITDSDGTTTNNLITETKNDNTGTGTNNTTGSKSKSFSDLPQANLATPPESNYSYLTTTDNEHTTEQANTSTEEHGTGSAKNTGTVKNTGNVNEEKNGGKDWNEDEEQNGTNNSVINEDKTNNTKSNETLTTKNNETENKGLNENINANENIHETENFNSHTDENMNSNTKGETNSNRKTDTNANGNMKQDYETGSISEKVQNNKMLSDEERTLRQQKAFYEKGRRGYSPADLIKKYRETFLNIDMLIINDLENLFMGVF